MPTDRPALNRAARVAYEAAMEGAPYPTSWECLPAHMHKQWDRVARRLLGPESWEYVCAAEELNTAARVVASEEADAGQYVALQRAIVRFEDTIWPSFDDDGLITLMIRALPIPPDPAPASAEPSEEQVEAGARAIRDLSFDPPAPKDPASPRFNELARACLRAANAKGIDDRRGSPEVDDMRRGS